MKIRNSGVKFTQHAVEIPNRQLIWQLVQEIRCQKVTVFDGLAIKNFQMVGLWATMVTQV